MLFHLVYLMLWFLIMWAKHFLFFLHVLTSLAFSLISKCCSGSLEELVSGHKAVLQEKEQQALRLEEKELQLQQEVRSLKKYYHLVVIF